MKSAVLRQTLGRYRACTAPVSDCVPDFIRLAGPSVHPCESPLQYSTSIMQMPVGVSHNAPSGVGPGAQAQAAAAVASRVVILACLGAFLLLPPSSKREIPGERVGMP